MPQAVLTRPGLVYSYRLAESSRNRTSALCQSCSGEPLGQPRFCHNWYAKAAMTVSLTGSDALCSSVSGASVLRLTASALPVMIHFYRSFTTNVNSTNTRAVWSESGQCRLRRCPPPAARCGRSGIPVEKAFTEPTRVTFSAFGAPLPVWTAKPASNTGGLSRLVHNRLWPAICTVLDR